MSETELSVAEAARELGVSLTYLYSLLWAGKLKARKELGRWRIPLADIVARQKATVPSE